MGMALNRFSLQIMVVSIGRQYLGTYSLLTNNMQAMDLRFQKSETNYHNVITTNTVEQENKPFAQKTD